MAIIDNDNAVLDNSLKDINDTLNNSVSSFRSAYGEQVSVPITPITQISAQYGLLGNVLTVIDNGASGTTEVLDERYMCETGTAPDGLASILTRRQLTYRAGQGALARFTAVFSPGVPNSQQGAGLITAENGYSFGYVNDNFGIVRAYDGHDELQILELTVAGGVGEVVTVTVNNIAYNVTLTGAGTTQDDAYEIATSLSQQVPNYSITSNGSKINLQAVISVPQGLFSYTGTTSTGTFTQMVAGAFPNVEFIPQAAWNRDTRIYPDDPDANLNPQAGNVYQIQLQYLGYGAVDFFVQDKKSGAYVLVHKIEYANTVVEPSVNNPTFRVGWISRNLGNTTNLTVSGASAAAFVEGVIARDTPPRSASHNQPTIGSDQTNVIAFRNRFTFGDKVNRAEIFPQLITGSTQATKFAIFKILLNPTFGGNVVFDYIDEYGSLVEVTRDSVPVSGGLEIGTIVVTADSTQVIRLNENNITPILPGSIICITATVPTGNPNDCQVAVTWQEDL